MQHFIEAKITVVHLSTCKSSRLIHKLPYRNRPFISVVSGSCGQTDCIRVEANKEGTVCVMECHEELWVSVAAGWLMVERGRWQLTEQHGRVSSL